MSKNNLPSESAFFSDGVRARVLRLGLSGAFLLLSLIHTRLNLFPVDPAWASVILCAFPIIARTFVNLLTRKDIRSDAPACAALILLLLSRKVFLTGLVSSIVSSGSLLEDVAAAGAKSAIERLVRKMPIAARVVTDKGQGYVHLEDIRVGDVIRVLPGEVIPVDGVILRGQATVDRSVISADPSPEDKTADGRVFSGSIVRSGTFDMRAGKTDSDSFAQRMIRVTRFADGNKAAASRAADRQATWSMVIAFVAAALTWILTGEILRTVAVLAAVCPFIVVTAASAAFTSAVGSAAKHGFLLRRGEALERIAGAEIVTVSIPAGTADAVKLNVANQFMLTGINAEMTAGDADVVLAEDRVWVPSHLRKLSGRLMKTIQLDLSLSLLVNFLALILAVTGLIGPAVVALIHVVSSVIIIFSASTLFRWSRKHAAVGVEKQQSRQEPVHDKG